MSTKHNILKTLICYIITVNAEDNIHDTPTLGQDEIAIENIKPIEVQKWSDRIADRNDSGDKRQTQVGIRLQEGWIKYMNILINLYIDTNKRENE